jgi:hypothetical protein
VSMQVLPVCSSVVRLASATVLCPPDYPYSVTRSQIDTNTQRVTIRY